MNYPGTLHAHTDYSNIRLRDSINRIDTLINTAIELGNTCVAITDHECISSFIRVEEYAEKIKEKYPDFKVIRGNEIYLTRNDLNGNNFSREHGDSYFHFILLAKDLEGYHQICELSTRAWMRSYMGAGLRRVPTYYRDLKEIVAPNKGHLIGSTACLGGQAAKFILKYRETHDIEILNTFKRWCLYMIDIFGKENFYLEMQPSNNSEQIFVNKTLLSISNKLGIPYIITTDAHYLKKNDISIHEAFLNSQDGERETKSFYETTYLMDTQEIESFFPYLNRAQLDAAYINIETIKNSCSDYSIKRPLHIPCLPWLDYPKASQPQLTFYTEKMPSLQYFIDSSYKEDNELVNAVIDGIARHPDLQNDDGYNALEECLNMTWISSEVNNARWSAYYLNLQKIIEECWKAGTIVGPARGSGGGFVLLYCLDIIQLNALRETTKCYSWRFLNPQRVSVLDIDFDISGLKRNAVLQHLRDVYSQDRVSNVATFRTEKSKSAILTAARGLGFTPEDASYYASLIDAKRGANYTLQQMYYGDPDKDIAPNSTFIEAMDNNPKLWEVTQKIEGLICGVGIHAGGIVFNDEPFTNTASLMRAPDGTIISGFELHDLEKCSLIKYDALSVEAMDKIQICLELLQKYGFLTAEPTLKQTYEKAIGIYNIERYDPQMWEMVWNHKIVSLFQMEQSSGIQGIALTKPANVNDLAVLNSVIRLMAPEKGAEQPLNMWVRYRNNISEWYDEMRAYGLKEEDIDWLSRHSAVTDGICESQEGLMSLVQEPRLGGNTLSFADKCRKALAKKIGKLMDECEHQYFENAEKANCDMKLVRYVWDILLAPQKGYSFNRSHCLGYSLVALQEMNLAYKFPIIFWNTANLIVDSAGVQNSDDVDEDEGLEVESESEAEPEVETVDIYEPEDWEEYDYEDLPDRSAKKKTKNKTVDFGKVATAIGKFQLEGINIAPPNINVSDYTFTPMVKENSIASGLRNITRISADLVQKIIDNRPYTSIEDFMGKVKVNKVQMINLLKCGAFDSLYPDRMGLIKQYIESISDTKSKLTLANVPMLIKYGCFEEEAAPYCRLYEFNKFVRKHLDQSKEYIVFPDKALQYYCNNYDADLLVDGNTLALKDWDKIYKKNIAPLAQFIKEDNTLLSKLNQKIVDEQMDIYAKGNISHFEMESISFYSHEHELEHVDKRLYGIVDYKNLPEEPIIDNQFTSKTGDTITTYKLFNIVGTVLNKNKIKNTVTILTPSGVANVKIYKTQFAKYDKQISEIGEDGKKHVMEKSWFSRGSLLMFQGFKRGDNFIPKAYKNSPHHCPIMKITDVEDRSIYYTDLRYDEL